MTRRADLLLAIAASCQFFGTATCLYAQERSILELEPAPSVARSISLPVQLVSRTVQSAGEPEQIQQRFPNGNIQIERWVAESPSGDLLNHGSYTEFNQQGEKIVSGVYELGQQVGEWKQILSESQAQQLVGFKLAGYKAPFQSIGTFVDGQLDGEWSCADASGNLLFIWSFREGKRNGPSTVFNSKGQVLQTINYADNLADGPAKLVLDSKKGVQDITFAKGRMQRRVDRNFPSAKGEKAVLMSQTWYLVPANINLESHDWMQSTLKYQTPNNTEAVMHGRSVTFFKNGQQSTEGQYENGKRTGTFAWWYSNGQQKTVGEYQNDKESGSWTWWHENGMKEAAGSYADGKKIEEWSVWSPEGKLVKRTDNSVPDDSTRMATRPELDFEK